MSKKELLKTFIETIQNKNLLTIFIKLIFDYDNFHDYNYIFRLSEGDDEIIIDIYDNVSENRFNRYIFNYNKGKYHTGIVKEEDVFVTYIDALNMTDNSNKLYKLAYMTTLTQNKIVAYAKTFLTDEFINILLDIIK